MAENDFHLGKNSTANVVRLVADLAENVAVPPGVELRSAEERLIWSQFTRARAQTGWRDFDLLIVAKAVRLEADIRKHQKSLDRSGVIIKNDRGTPIVNPFVAVIDSMQRQQLALIRSLSLNQTAHDPRVLNDQGTEQSRLRRVFDDVDDLIAR